MDAYIKAINSLVSPMETACELGLKPEVKDNSCLVYCPSCSKPMFVLDAGYVCSSHSCSFKAGGMVDMIALVEGTSVRKAYELFRDMYQDRLKKMSRFDDVEFNEAAGRYLWMRRKLFDFFVKTGKKKPDRIAEIQTHSAVSKAGISLEENRLSACVASAEAMEDLEAIIMYFGAKLPTLPVNVATLLIPYFSNHHTIDSFTLSVPTRPSLTHKIIEVERNSRITWAGLLQAHPKTSQIEIVSSGVDMLITNSRYARTGTGKEISMHCRYKGTTQDVGWKPEKAVYSMPRVATTEPLMLLSRLDSALDDMRLSVNGMQLPVRKYLLDQCLQAIIEDGMSLDVRLLLDSIKLSDEERHKLLVMLHDRRHFDEADALRRHFRVQLVHKDDKQLLYASPDGYLVSKDDSNDKSPISNFTIDLEYNMVFADSQDVFHAGSVCTTNSRQEVFLKTTDVDRINDLELAIRSNVGEDSKLDDKLPTVRDKSAGRILSSYLRHKIAELPKVEGVPFLGWNEARTRFHGPFWYADEKTGCHTIKRVFHPFEKVFDNYTNVPFDNRLFDPDIPVELSNIISQFVAMMLRSYFNYQVKPVVVLNDENHRNLIQDLYAAVGQVSAIPLNVNIRSNTDVAASFGFPYYASGFSNADASKRRFPGIYLSEEGSPIIHTTYEPAVIDKTKRTFVHVVYETITWILKTGAKNFSTVSSVSLDQSYILEGAAVISEVCGTKEWMKRNSQFSTIESFLAQVKYEEVNRYVHYNIDEHIVTVDLSSASDLDMDTVVQELRTLGAKNISVNEGKVTVDAGSMMSALESFYQRKPEVEETFTLAEALIDK